MMSKVTRNFMEAVNLASRRRPANAILRFFLIGGFCLLALPLGAQQRKPLPPPPSGKRPHFVSIYPNFQLTAAGDAIIETPMKVHQNDPAFMGVVKAVRQGDARVLNFEGGFAGTNAYPVADATVSWIYSAPARLKDLQWIGFNLFNAANNHSVDFGTQGVLDTIHVFRRNDAVFAGIGKNLGAARAPAYLSTPNGRVALISCTSTIIPQSPAGQARPDMRGRPGASVLRYQTRYVVNAATFDTLRKMAENPKYGLGPAGANSARLLQLGFNTGITFGSKPVTFVEGNHPGVETIPNAQDMAQILAEIRSAKEMADYVVVYMHAHEQIPDKLREPAQFVVEFAHAAINAGADVFVASGPHVLRPIEIYKGKVIMYSLGNFILQNSLMYSQPQDSYQKFGLGLHALPAELFDQRSDYGTKLWDAEPGQFRSVVADVVFRNGKPAEVKLTPIVLGFGEVRADRGFPRLAGVAAGTRILKRMQKLSAPYGTRIQIQNGIGTIMIQNASSQ